MSDGDSKVHGVLTGRVHSWLITGVAGFIGSNLLESLLQAGQNVVGLDNFFSGRQTNLDQVRQRVGADAWQRFTFLEGDIRDGDVVRRACGDIDYVLHHAALGSVPRSLDEPGLCHEINVTGFLNVIRSARACGVKRVVYASSSAVYGDDEAPSKQEARIGVPLSPYAASKWMDEIYAGVFQRAFNYGAVGLRYFNIYGPRQDPNGAYAAVIPKWISTLLGREAVCIHGDGETSRDFCYVDDVVQANLRAALVENENLCGAVLNIGAGQRTTLNQLFQVLRDELAAQDASIADLQPVHADFRPGDIRHSLADIGRAREWMGFEPVYTLERGVRASFEWYRAHPGS